MHDSLVLRIRKRLAGNFSGTLLQDDNVRKFYEHMDRDVVKSLLLDSA